MNIAFILETALIILAVFLIGAIVGYLIRCWFFKPKAVATSPRTVNKPAAQSVPEAQSVTEAQSVPKAQSVTEAPKPASPAPASAASSMPEASPIAGEPPAAGEQNEKADRPEPEVSSDEKGAEADGKPVGLPGPRGGRKDDLKRIKGIGPKIEGVLNELGIFHFDQIANWSPQTIDWINGFLSFKGRVQRENWIDQSRALASGDETEFSKRVDKGKVPSSKK